MKYYFSGINKSSHWETLRMLMKAEVKHILIDSFDYLDYLNDPHAPKIPNDVEIFLDSGAYKIFKNPTLPSFKDTWTEYVEFATNCVQQNKNIAHVAQPDVIGDYKCTRDIWKKVSNIKNIPWVPIFQWGDEIEYLEELIQLAPVVGIGGLAQPMRKEENIAFEVQELCGKYPQRIHIFGLNSLKATHLLQGLAYSGDSSKFLAGARRKEVIFLDSKTRELTSKDVKNNHHYAHMSRFQLCVINASNMNYINRNAS